VITGRSDDLGQDIERSRLRFVERQLLAQQITGSHEIGALGGGTLEYRYGFAQANRAEPDRREYFYADESADPDAPPYDFQISARPAGNQRIWNDLTDRIHDVGVDWTQPIDVWSELTAKVKLGGSAVVRDRSYDTLRLTMRAPRSLSAEDRRLPPERIWATDNIDATDGWILEDTTQPTDAYRAEQTIQAGYAMGTIPLARSLEVTAGVRVERSRQLVTTFSPFSRDTTALEAELDNTDVLPSAQLKWQASGELIVRGGYGKSVTRPDFRELSESQYRDVITATRFVGNPELERGTIHHADVRAEYYFSTDEVASIAAFYKSFNSPIEQIDLGGVDRSVSWDNADSATNLGIEVEGRRRFGFIHESLEDTFAAVNLAFIRSEVDLGEGGGVSTSQQRPLQGQSPFVVNIQLGYDDAADSGISAVLLYNVFGRRIRDVGRLGTPDVYEQPFHQLDLVYSHELTEHWKLKVKATNLLGDEVEFRQRSKVPHSYAPGRSLSVSVGWSY
jgi:TonB-dependent receptor